MLTKLGSWMFLPLWFVLSGCTHLVIVENDKSIVRLNQNVKTQQFTIQLNSGQILKGYFLNISSDSLEWRDELSQTIHSTATSDIDHVSFKTLGSKHGALIGLGAGVALGVIIGATSHESFYSAEGEDPGGRVPKSLLIPVYSGLFGLGGLIIGAIAGSRMESRIDYYFHDLSK